MSGSGLESKGWFLEELHAKDCIGAHVHLGIVGRVPKTSPNPPTSSQPKG